MKKLLCIVLLLLSSFSLCTTASSPTMEPFTADLVYHGEKWEFHDLVYREEPIEVILLNHTEPILLIK